MTLTEAAFWTKRFGVIAAIMFVIFVIIILVLTLQPKQKLPPQYLIANYACTDTKEEFLENSTIKITPLKLASGSELNFELETDTGRLDGQKAVIDIYRFVPRTQIWTSMQQAQVLAKKMGFNEEEIMKSTTVYSWQDTKLKKNLEIQAKNMNFTLRSDPNMIRKETEGKTTPTKQDAARRAAAFLRDLGMFYEDYAEGMTETTFIKVNPDGSFSKASSEDQAQLVKVDFFRYKPMISIMSSLADSKRMTTELTRTLQIQPQKSYKNINGERVEHSTFNALIAFNRTQNSNISVYVGPSDSSKSSTSDIYQVDYTYNPLEQESCGTYELLAPQVAFEKLQQGEGYLVYLYEKEGDDVSPYKPKAVKRFTVNKDATIVYYEPKEETTYLLPMYLISGIATFTDGTQGLFDFYYPAINYSIVQDKINTPAPQIKKKSSFF